MVAGLSERVGQQFVMDNRPGASGNIALEILAKSPPDGYTLMVTTPTVTVNPALYSKPGYDAVNDFAPAALMASTVYVLVVHSSLPVKSVRELVALAKAKPRQLYYSSDGNGAAAHLPAGGVHVYRRNAVAGGARSRVDHEARSLRVAGLARLKRGIEDAALAKTRVID